MPAERHSFKKEERLRSRKDIETLFSRGEVAYSYPLRLIYLVKEPGDNPPAKMGVAVSRRNFKKATDRNLIKRRIREAYRQNKEILVQPLRERGVSAILMIQYTAKKILPYCDIEVAVKELLQKTGRAPESRPELKIT